MALVVSRRAKGHLRIIKRWYEGQRTGLGGDFLKAVHRKLETIEAFPTRFAVQFEDVRIAMVDGFPYLILFSVGTANVSVIGVFHHGRDPRVWKRL